MIRVRFAPSPTGYLHIGGARTALFNWMYARAQGGKFVLRIEDTDLKRSSPEFIDEILKGMEWLGMDWDEFYKQSERFDMYREQAEKLLESGQAYRDGEAVLLKMPEQEVKLYDLIRGEIVFDTAILKDEVLIKSDGSPTYSFACVVDDAQMEISHVIRGEDHISNTPKQMMITFALGLKPPKYAHLPLIMGEDGSRMSKRTGAVAVSDYQQQGFLPEGLVNYLLLLGWSPGNNQEVIDLAAAVKKFSIKKVQKSAAVFSMEKLRWLNSQYIKTKSSSELKDLFLAFLESRDKNIAEYDGKWLENVIKLYQSRMPTLADLLERADFLFSDDFSVEAESFQADPPLKMTEAFGQLHKRFAEMDDFSVNQVEKVFRDCVADLGLKAADLVHPVRLAISGKTVGPGLFETIAVLGKARTLQRLSVCAK